MVFSDNERLVLGTICRYFHEHAKWPTYDYLDTALSDHDGLDVENVGQKLEPFMYDAPYAPMAGWDPTRQTFLNISALQTCLSDGIFPEIAEDLDAFMQVVHLCIERYRARDHDNPQSAEITSAEVRDRFGMSDLMLRKVFELISRANLTAGSSSSEAQWTFNVSPNIRKYLRVSTIEDFLRVRENLRTEQRQRYLPAMQGPATPNAWGNHALSPIAEPSLGQTTGTASNQVNVSTIVQLRPVSLFPSGPFTRIEHLCFVLMPFAEELRPVYDEAIVPAVTQAGLECQRADEIMKPGGIMAQVWESLMQARVVIADLTNMNANVFYELGLAHTIGHDVILLTQDKKWVPFDLQHMRWVKYQLDEHGLHLVRQKLRTILREVLGAAAPKDAHA